MLPKCDGDIYGGTGCRKCDHCLSELNRLSERQLLINRIQEICTEFFKSDDDKFILNCPSLTQLYYIESTLKGWSSALDDWAKLIKLIQSKYNISTTEILDIAKQNRNEICK